MLEDRRSEVLRVLVEEHIRTGETVSSKAIAELSDLGVSAATIRNDLVALEQDGYVVQPHTSAGRIPTAKAYRYYVDHLDNVRFLPQAHLKVSSLFGEMHLELSKLLRATSDLLSEITELPSVVVAPGVTRDRIRAVHTVQVTSDQALVIVITEGGRVVQQRGRIRIPVNAEQMETGQRIVSAELVGAELGSVRSLPKEKLDDLDEPLRELVLTITDCVHLAATGTEMFVAGAQMMAAVWDDATTMSRVLEILQREAEVMKILAGASAMTVQLGAELLEHEALDLAVVSRTFDAAGEAGSVGVIGPMRMNYRRAISAVEEVSRELETQIGSGAD